MFCSITIITKMLSIENRIFFIDNNSSCLLEISKNLIRDDYLKLLYYYNTWKYINEDENYIKIDCIFINEQTNELENN